MDENDRNENSTIKHKPIPAIKIPPHKIPKEQYMYITKFAVIKIKDKNKFYDPTITGKRVHAT